MMLKIQRDKKKNPKRLNKSVWFYLNTLKKKLWFLKGEKYRKRIKICHQEILASAMLNIPQINFLFLQSPLWRAVSFQSNYSPYRNSLLQVSGGYTTLWLYQLECVARKRPPLFSMSVRKWLKSVPSAHNTETVSWPCPTIKRVESYNPSVCGEKGKVFQVSPALDM